MHFRKRIMCILTCVMLFSGCSSAKVEHNYLYSDSANLTVCNEKKALTKFKSLYPEDERTLKDKIYEQLESGMDIDINAPTVDFEIGDLSLNKLQPNCTTMSFYVSMPFDVKNLQIVFEFDNGTISETSISILPGGTLMQASVKMPKDAESVRVYDFSYDKASIVLGELSCLKDKPFERLSNNTFAFDCDETRYLVLDDYGFILDDVILGGKGEFTTGNGAAYLQEVKKVDGA